MTGDGTEAAVERRREGGKGRVEGREEGKSREGEGPDGEREGPKVAGGERERRQ